MGTIGRYFRTSTVTSQLDWWKGETCIFRCLSVVIWRHISSNENASTCQMKQTNGEKAELFHTWTLTCNRSHNVLPDFPQFLKGGGAGIQHVHAAVYLYMNFQIFTYFWLTHIMYGIGSTFGWQHACPMYCNLFKDKRKKNSCFCQPPRHFHISPLGLKKFNQPNSLMKTTLSIEFETHKLLNCIYKMEQRWQ